VLQRSSGESALIETLQPNATVVPDVSSPAFQFH
jgi:hypothetical protein